MCTSFQPQIAKALAFQVTLACALLAGCEQFAQVGRVTEEGGAPADARAEGGGDAGETSDAALDAKAPFDSGGGAHDGSSASCARQVAVCNPVSNTGCLEQLDTQCAPDLAADRLAGYCTFVGPIQDGGLECLNTIVTESCPPTTTCFEGRCRALCFCDADCGEGQCCTEALGELGFHLCAPCEA